MPTSKGQRSHPSPNIKGAMPRARLSKLPRGPVDADDLEEQSAIYLRLRNRTMETKCKTAEMELGTARGKLIEKDLATRQAAYLLIAMRRSLLALPAKMRRKFGEERFPHEMVTACQGLITEALNEAAQLPQSVEPGWLERLEEG
jgi:hypothetical protein